MGGGWRKTLADNGLRAALSDRNSGRTGLPFASIAGMTTIENAVSTVESRIAFQINWIDAMLGKLRAVFTVETCRKHLSLFRVIGHTGTLLAGVLGLFFGIVAAIKSDSFMVFILGFAWLLGLLIIDYVSRRFDQTSDRLVASTRSFLSSTVYVDAIALILLVTSALIFGVGVYGAIKTGGIAFLARFGGLSVWMFYMGLITLNAGGMLNIEFRNELKAEEEGVGLLEFNAKSCLLAVPFYFGSGLLFGLLNIIWVLIRAAKDDEPFASALLNSTPYFLIIAIIAALPLLACLTFLVFYSFIAAVKSLIRIASVVEKRQAS